MYLSAGSSTDVTIPLVGSPTSVSFKVYDHVGALLDEGAVVPEANATSVTYVVAGEFNVLASSPSWERRTVRWSYDSGTRTVNGSQSYRVETGVFIDADVNTVRALLGVDEVELPDDQIDLISAFFLFRARADATVMDALLLGYDARPLMIARAIAAIAALDHVDAMATKIALKESSGSNSYERGKVDWTEVRTTLQAIIDRGYGVLSDGTIYAPTLFDIGSRTDVFTS